MATKKKTETELMQDNGLIRPKCPCGGFIRARRQWQKFDQASCKECGRQVQCVEDTPEIKLVFS